MGIQMEGPFFSEKKKGAQNGAYLRDPDFEAFQRLYDVSEGLSTSHCGCGGGAVWRGSIYPAGKQALHGLCCPYGLHLRRRLRCL